MRFRAILNKIKEVSPVGVRNFRFSLRLSVCLSFFLSFFAVYGVFILGFVGSELSYSSFDLFFFLFSVERICWSEISWCFHVACWGSFSSRRFWVWTAWFSIYVFLFFFPRTREKREREKQRWFPFPPPPLTDRSYVCWWRFRHLLVRRARTRFLWFREQDCPPLPFLVHLLSLSLRCLYVWFLYDRIVALWRRV